MEPRNYKIYSNGIHEIVTADNVQFMPTTGQTIFSLNGEVLHIAPASSTITSTDKSYSKLNIEMVINEIEKEIKSNFINIEEITKIRTGSKKSSRFDYVSKEELVNNSLEETNRFLINIVEKLKKY